MADDTDAAHLNESSLLDRHPMRDDEGQIRPEFVEEMARAIKAGDAALLRHRHAVVRAETARRDQGLVSLIER